MAYVDTLDKGFVINGRFEIIKRIGEGGFAVVFEGKDRNLERSVAIKVLHGTMLDGERGRGVIERFEREARLAASVEHPCIVNIYDAGEIGEGGPPFMVMEYLRGRSLQDQLDNHGAMEAEALLPLFVDMLVGLGYAHEAGIVHKDLKPDNVFYKYPDSMRAALCIVDFGIAHIGRSNSNRVTKDGEFFGTPSYMAPEYISDQRVSAAVDVYQCGLMLVECLTGGPVVDHQEPVAALLKHLNGDYNIPPALKEGPLGPVISRALAQEPAQRYPDALAFSEALAGVDASALPSRVELLEADERPASEERPTQDGVSPSIHAGSEARGDDDGSSYPEIPLAEPSLSEEVSTAAEEWRKEEELDDRRQPVELELDPERAPELDALAESINPTAEVAASEDTGPGHGMRLNSDSRTVVFPQGEPAGEAPAGGHARRNGALALLGLLGGCALVIGIALAASGGEGSSQGALEVDEGVAFAAGEPPEDEASEGADPGEELAQGEPEAGEEASAAAGPDAQEPGEIEPAPEPAAPVEVEVVSEPLGAEVFEGEVRLGTTPLRLEFAEGAAPARELELRKDGHEGMAVRVSATQAPSVSTTLPRIARRPPKKQRPKPRKNPPPEEPPSPEEDGREEEDSPKILLPQ